eukprot:755974-Hanusia_phi.AAC.6
MSLPPARTVYTAAAYSASPALSLLSSRRLRERATLDRTPGPGPRPRPEWRPTRSPYVPGSEVLPGRRP